MLNTVSCNKKQVSSFFPSSTCCFSPPSSPCFATSAFCSSSSSFSSSSSSSSSTVPPSSSSCASSSKIVRFDETNAANKHANSNNNNNVNYNSTSQRNKSNICTINNNNNVHNINKNAVRNNSNPHVCAMNSNNNNNNSTNSHNKNNMKSNNNCNSKTINSSNTNKRNSFNSVSSSVHTGSLNCHMNNINNSNNIVCNNTNVNDSSINNSQSSHNINTALPYNNTNLNNNNNNNNNNDNYNYINKYTNETPDADNISSFYNSNNSNSPAITRTVSCPFTAHTPPSTADTLPRNSTNNNNINNTTSTNGIIVNGGGGGGGGGAAEEGKNRRIMQFYKSRVCPWYQHGRCHRGNECNYAHSNEELRPRPDLTKTRMCPFLAECNSSTCAFAHSEAELRVTPAYYKVCLCMQFERRGWCSYGSKCRYAHGEAELREVPLLGSVATEKPLDIENETDEFTDEKIKTQNNFDECNRNNNECPNTKEEEEIYNDTNNNNYYYNHSNSNNHNNNNNNKHYTCIPPFSPNNSPHASASPSSSHSTYTNGISFFTPKDNFIEYPEKDAFVNTNTPKGGGGRGIGEEVKEGKEEEKRERTNKHFSFLSLPSSSSSSVPSFRGKGVTDGGGGNEKNVGMYTSKSNILYSSCFASSPNSACSPVSCRVEGSSSYTYNNNHSSNSNNINTHITNNHHVVPSVLSPSINKLNAHCNNRIYNHSLEKQTYILPPTSPSSSSIVPQIYPNVHTAAFTGSPNSSFYHHCEAAASTHDVSQQQSNNNNINNNDMYKKHSIERGENVIMCINNNCNNNNKNNNNNTNNSQNEKATYFISSSPSSSSSSSEEYMKNMEEGLKHPSICTWHDSTSSTRITNPCDSSFCSLSTNWHGNTNMYNAGVQSFHAREEDSSLYDNNSSINNNNNSTNNSNHINTHIYNNNNNNNTMLSSLSPLYFCQMNNNNNNNNNNSNNVTKCSYYTTPDSAALSCASLPQRCVSSGAYSNCSHIISNVDTTSSNNNNINNNTNNNNNNNNISINSENNYFNNDIYPLPEYKYNCYTNCGIAYPSYVYKCSNKCYTPVCTRLGRKTEEGKNYTEIIDEKELTNRGENEKKEERGRGHMQKGDAKKRSFSLSAYEEKILRRNSKVKKKSELDIQQNYNDCNIITASPTPTSICAKKDKANDITSERQDEYLCLHIARRHKSIDLTDCIDDIQHMKKCNKPPETECTYTTRNVAYTTKSGESVHTANLDEDDAMLCDISVDKRSSKSEQSIQVCDSSSFLSTQKYDFSTELVLQNMQLAAYQISRMLGGVSSDELMQAAPLQYSD